MAILDRAVLAAVEAQVLAPDVIEAIVVRVLAEPQKPSSTVERDRPAAMLAEVEQELERLTRAVASGAETPSMLTAIKGREARRAALAARLAAQAAVRDVSTLDLAEVRRIARQQVAEWTGLMTRHTPQARPVLRKLLHGRVVVQPTPEREDCCGEITATATIGKVLAGSVVLPHILASPRGVWQGWQGVPRTQVAGLVGRAA
jgi:hypothetical protein